MKMNRFTIAVLVGFCTILCACNPEAEFQKIIPTKDKDSALHYIYLLKNREFFAIENELDPAIKTAEVHSTLEKMASILPKENPISTKVIGFNVFTTPDHTDKNISFEFQYPKAWILANVATRTSQSGFTIVGFNINPIPDSLEHINQFTLKGKGIIAFTILGTAIGIPLFTLYSLILCIRCKLRRKWLWILFIMIGLGKFSFNWITGLWTIVPLAIQLFGAGTFAPVFGPLTISISFPLGAITF